MSGDKDECQGIACGENGCVLLTGSEADEIFECLEREDTKLKESLPDSVAALRSMGLACARLKQIGWSEGIYCPKDGSGFAVIQFGSTGIHVARYASELAGGQLLVSDSLFDPDGVLWKRIEDLTLDEKELMDECEEMDKAHRDRMIRAFSEG